MITILPLGSLVVLTYFVLKEKRNENTACYCLFLGRWLTGRCGCKKGKIQNKGKIKIGWLPDARRCLRICKEKKGTGCLTILPPLYVIYVLWVPGQGQ